MTRDGDSDNDTATDQTALPAGRVRRKYHTLKVSVVRGGRVTDDEQWTPKLCRRRIPRRSETRRARALDADLRREKRRIPATDRMASL